MNNHKNMILEKSNIDLQEFILNQLYFFDVYDLRCILSIIRYNTTTKDYMFKHMNRYDLKEYVRDETVNCQDKNTLLEIVYLIKTLYPDIIIE
jgi:hypothetical protein